MDGRNWYGATLVACTVLGTVTSFVGFSQSSFAQNAIAPDSTLPQNTVVNFNNNTYTITGGTQVGANQFHSFNTFSVPTQNTAHFDNALQTANVIGRVTGNSSSDIDGTLRTNGAANLYLINPNGIIFGQNARLDIGGSFTASTANSIKFSDGSEFSATNPQAPPLLKVNVPIGLQYNAPSPAPVTNTGNLTVGGNLTLSGGSITSTGTLNVPQGNLLLDAVAGDVKVNQFQADAAKLTATQGVFLENGRFQTSGDLQLLGKDSVVLQDSAAKPLNLQVGGNLLVQGDRAVTVDTLANPNSSLWVGKNVLLRSDNPVAIDAHWNAGGDLRVEQLNGSLGDLYSPHDPTFQFSGNVSFNNYTGGSSLQILAGGNVTATGTIFINSVDAAEFINSTVILSDGSPLQISGTTRPVLDIRAGVRSDGFFHSPTVTATGLPTSADINIRNITFSNTLAGSNGLVFLTNQYAPNQSLSGNIVVRAINTANDENAGSVVIDSKGSINLANTINSFSNYANAGMVNVLANGNINIAGIDTTSGYSNAGNISLLSRNGSIDTRLGDIYAYSYYYDAGKVALKASQDILSGNISTESGYLGVANDIYIDARSVSISNSKLSASAYGKNGNAGNITFNATEKVSLSNSRIYSRVEKDAVGDGGNISINANSVYIYSSNLSASSILGQGNSGSVNILGRNGNIDIRTGVVDTSSFFGLGGDVTLTAGQDIISRGIDTSSLNSNAGSVLFSSRNGNIDTRNGSINASSFLGLGGNVTLTAGQDILSRGIDTSSLDSNAGSVLLSSRNGNIDARNGSINAFSSLGFGGNVTLIASQDVKAGNILTFGGRDGGDIAINATSISFLNSKISASTFNQGNAGNITFTAIGLVSFDGGEVYSLLEPSAIGKGGDLTVNAGFLVVKNGAQLLTYTNGKGNAGNVNIAATDNVLFSGVGTGVVSTVEAGAVGRGGDININAKSVSVTDGAQLASSTLGQGKAGNVTISAIDSVSFARYSAVFSDVKSGAIGDGGNVTINARSLSITDSAQLLTDTYGQGNAGNVNIVAADSVFLSGVDTNLYHSAISSSTRSNFGNGGSVFVTTSSMNMTNGAFIDSSTFSNKIGGNIQINTQKLDMSNGSQITSVALNSGNAGNIRINLGQSLVLDGVNTMIAASTDKNSSGNGGSIFIDPPLVSITNGAGISVNSLGTGNGGNMDIFAGKFVFANNAFLTANTASGEGGNINLRIADIFFPRNGSSINATAGNNGNGGNINLSALFLVSIPSENNDIFANASFGKGGNINITANGIFGFQSRPRLTPLSDITASSDYGVQGTVNINTMIDPSKGLNNLPVNVSDPSRLVKQSCIADRTGSSFTITGKGGVPAKPSDRPTDMGVLDNFGTLGDRSQTAYTASSLDPQQPSTPNAIVEATGWIVNAQKQVVLVAGETPTPSNIRCPQ